MEDGLGANDGKQYQTFFSDVLILVLVEDGLGEFLKIKNILKNLVLILVLVEDGLGGATRLRGRKGWR